MKRLRCVYFDKSSKAVPWFLIANTGILYFSFLLSLFTLFTLVQHPLASYQNAMIATVLHKRMPCVDGMTLNRWYGAGNGRQRFRVIQHRLDQAEATLLLLDALDIIGRTGETARWVFSFCLWWLVLLHKCNYFPTVCPPPPCVFP